MHKYNMPDNRQLIIYEGSFILNLSWRILWGIIWASYFAPKTWFLQYNQKATCSGINVQHIMYCGLNTLIAMSWMIIMHLYNRSELLQAFNFTFIYQNMCKSEMTCFSATIHVMHMRHEVHIQKFTITLVKITRRTLNTHLFRFQSCTEISSSQCCWVKIETPLEKPPWMTLQGCVLSPLHTKSSIFPSSSALDHVTRRKKKNCHVCILIDSGARLYGSQLVRCR